MIQLERARCDSAERFLEPKFGGLPADQSLTRLTKQRFTRSVQEPEGFVFIEGEHRQVDFLQHLSEKSRGLHRAETLLAKNLLEGIRLEIRDRERTSRSRASDPNREVPFAQRCKHVGKGL
jgi:hypothetical protein